MERKSQKMQKEINEIKEALVGITKRLSALEKKPKTPSKTTTKTATKKEEIFFDITQKGKVNRRDLESLENSYNHNRERYGKKFKESFQTFKDFKKSLNDLGSIKTRDRVYYSKQGFDKLKGATK